MANSDAGSSSDVARALGGEFHVFLSFRAPDCRHGFTDFLYHGLVDAGVRVFKDDDELQEGEVIGGNILRAINNSKIYVPIFSRTYASSIWCLREFAHIMDNLSKSEGEKSILPIFLDVEPEDVKLKTPRYTDALLEHAYKFPNEVEAWRKALIEVDEINGWNVKRDQSQAAIVKLVVEKVLEKLEIKQNSVTEQLVGFEDRVKHLTELLDVNHRDVRFIGIYGMGGIGKTTIAKVVFNQLSSNFGNCCSFLENVRESLSTKEGIVQLQKKLLADFVGSGFAERLMDSEQAMRTIGDTLSTKKILVVLDDVDKKEHIRKLIGGYSLCLGSRIIITTRNKFVLNVKGIKNDILWYEMQKMDDDLALQLFSRHAFGRDFPLDDYHGLSSKIVLNMGGVPLAVEVIGSLLNGKVEAFWKDTLVRLREVPAEEILETLRISYDNLDKYQQQIFLDIACFLSNEDKTEAIYMWTDCQFYPIRGIKVLIDRRLIKISDNDRIMMHDQLIDLGRRIVRQESPFNPRKRSRLWITTEAVEILRTKKRKEEVQALKIFRSGDSIEITNEDFERLQNLRFLELNWGTYAGDFASCHSNLRWLSWSSPRGFRADNMYFDHLVVCKLDAIDFKNDSKAWDLLKGSYNLKVLSLTRCTGITTIPDFSKCSCLERLTIVECFSLKRIERFIGDLRFLIELKIEKCSDLTDLPNEVGALVKLKHFSMSGCRGLRKLPGSLGNLTSLTELDLSDTMIRGLPNSIVMLKSLRILRLPIGAVTDREHHVWQLPSGINTLVTLEELDICGRTEITGEIPVGVGESSSLRILNLEHTRVCEIPRTINMLHHLQILNLRSCHEIQVLPELPTSLTCLLLESKSLCSVPNLSNLTNLVELQLSDGSGDKKKSNSVTGSDLSWIRRLSRLKKLELNLLNFPAPPELASLSHLEELKLSCLDLEALVQLPSSQWSLRNLSTLEFYWCEMEDVPLDRLPQLEKLVVHHCKRLQTLFSPSELKKLWQVCVSYCQELIEIQVSKSLESLSVIECESLTKICGFSYPMNLEYLRIRRCKRLTNVEGLNDLKSLKSLEVTQCPSLRRLIDASCTNIPDDCLVKIQGCGDFAKDSTQNDSFGISLKSYRDEILLDTSNFESKSDKTETEGRKKATAWWEKLRGWRTSKESCNKAMEEEEEKGKEGSGLKEVNKKDSAKEASAAYSHHVSRVSSGLMKFFVDKTKSRHGSDPKKEAPVPKDGPTVHTAAQTFTFPELAAATKNFRPECLLREGGFGRVYKGRLERSGQAVAVNQLDQNGLQGINEFLAEVLRLSLLDHPNLVNLIGYCVDGNQRLLVYEFVPLGSLEDHLHDLPPDKEPLDWNTRMKIAAGAAKGLEYLHDKATPPVLYGDLKSSNILLDEGFNPKLSDFGLAKLGPAGDKTRVEMGTYGYIAPDYARTGQLTLKSDLYSFGVVFLELITGRKAFDNSRAPGEHNLVAWARPLFRDRRTFPKMADPLLQGRYPMRGLYQALAVAAMCLQDQATQRPVVGDIVTALTYLASHTYDPGSASAQ